MTEISPSRCAEIDVYRILKSTLNLSSDCQKHLTQQMGERCDHVLYGNWRGEPVHPTCSWSQWRDTDSLWPSDEGVP